MAAAWLRGDSMPDRQQHQAEVRRFLQQHFSTHDWIFSLPPGSGMETYFARGNGPDYFVKVGARVERYLRLAEIGLTPPILAHGQLESGPSVLVQERLNAHTPSRKEFHQRLDQVAVMIRQMHNCPQIQAVLPAEGSRDVKGAGLSALADLREKWNCYKMQVPAHAGFVDDSLEFLHQQIDLFSGLGLVASHNDICNANWLFTTGGEIHLVDFEAMSMDDPACDVGALLWWYYPPALRLRFLEFAGYAADPEFPLRMQVRLALHCLNIILPRQHSFDRFTPEFFGEALTDFRAVLAGEQNPQGYDD
jgi:hypothetical protein